MTRLSSSVETIKDYYQIVVIGSGYGGAIAASRLSRAGQQVCILERGKEFQPGEYPDTELEALREFQMDSPDSQVGLPTGLYDVRINPEINVILGCGLGGTSLINANVSLRAEQRVFEDARWPQALKNDRATLIDEGYQRAEEMLKPTPYPNDFPALPKLVALEKSAQHLGVKNDFYRPPINVNFVDGVNHVGVEQRACKLCGDCVSGCNHGAKNTVLMNYLPDARNHGAEIFTQVSVRYIKRQDDQWVVYYQLMDAGREAFGAPPLFVKADVVILSAGSLGSTEILLRSRQYGLSVSDKLGQHFSGNGDAIGFAYNNDVEINAIGFGHRAPSTRQPVGPSITGIIDLRQQATLEDGIVLEEGAFPGAVANLLPLALKQGAALLGTDTDTGILDTAEETFRKFQSDIYGPYEGATNNTQMLLIMSHDDADNAGGTMYLDDNRLRIAWEGIGRRPLFAKVNDLMRKATIPLGGKYLPNPVWNKTFGHDLFVAHPLGGCRMAETAQEGVVNHKGQVFSGNESAEVYQGLYVCDAAVIPCSLGVNPLLTISALAERCCVLLAADRGWKIDYDLKPVAPRPSAPIKPGVQFTETMKGFVSTSVTDDYQKAYEQGRIDETPCEFVLTVKSNDVVAMLNDINHRARMVGTLTLTALSPHPMMVTEGEFNLFVKDEERVETRLMRYVMKATSQDGKTYFFSGFKSIHDDPGVDLWADTTTLYVDIYDDDERTKPIGAGILKIELSDFTKQLQTIQITNPSTPEENLSLLASFGGFFAATLFEAYGGVFAGHTVFNPDAPPRKKRVLRVGAPSIYTVKTSDGANIRLTRYKGGERGPVMLTHGLGVSSSIFSIDTIETNLLEYLYANRFDVWLLDYRGSIDLSASKTQFTGDDVAIYDYPAAVNFVRQTAGVDSVQMVVHCFGSTTFFMAMLAGLEGVRSAVTSQAAIYAVMPTLPRIKAGLYLPSFLDKVGIDLLSAYVDTHANWVQRLYDTAANLYPTEFEEYCSSPVCHRIAVMYSQLYEHEQLNTATHDAMHELFGIANVSALEHLALIVRRGHLVAANGAERYLPHLDRLAIPIAFIHGQENACFLPEGTEHTYNALVTANGDLYSRYIIPDYGHIDCIFGKNAAKDVYPHILQHLEKTAP